MKLGKIYNLQFTIEDFVRIFCLMLLPMHLMTYVTGVAGANSGDVPEIILSDSASLATEQPTEQLRQQLFREEITPFEEEKEPESKVGLMQLILQIRSIEFPSEGFTPDNTTIKKEKPAVDPNIKPSGDSELKTDESKPETSVPGAGGPVTGQTLQMLTGLLKEPQKLNNPAQLAEILYLDGKLREAAALYQEALRLTRPDDNAQTANRAWFLFQAANCLRDSDITAAAKLFTQLITEYPDSPWTESAKAQNKIILWYQQDNPDKLIAQSRQQFNSSNRPENTDNDPNEQN